MIDRYLIDWDMEKTVLVENYQADSGYFICSSFDVAKLEAENERYKEALEKIVKICPMTDVNEDKCTICIAQKALEE